MKLHIIQTILIGLAVALIGFVLYERHQALQHEQASKPAWNALIAEQSAANAEVRASAVALEEEIVEDQREGVGDRPTAKELRGDIADFEWARQNLVAPDSPAAQDLIRDVAWCKRRLKTAR